MRAIVLLGLLFAGSALASPLTFENVWIREAPPGATVMVAYATMKNTTNTMLQLIGVSSEDFGQGQLHHMQMIDGVMRMRQTAKFDIAPGRSLQLKPGGNHIMLDEPKKKLKAGQKITLHFKLSNGETIDVDAEVRKAN